MSKEIISTEQAPAALGPYSQAIKAGATLFISGQVPIDPKTGDVVRGSIQEQTKQVLDNLKAILTEAGYGLEDVVKAEVFIADLEEFEDFNEVFAEYFSEAPPARACIEAARLPMDVGLELSAIAVK